MSMLYLRACAKGERRRCGTLQMAVQLHLLQMRRHKKLLPLLPRGNTQVPRNRFADIGTGAADPDVTRAEASAVGDDRKHARGYDRYRAMSDRSRDRPSG